MARATDRNLAMLFVVAAAMIDANGKILLQQRPVGRSMAGLWEFPGGKVEAGETPEDALMREITEELGVCVAKEALTPIAFASEAVGDVHLILLLYLVDAWEGTPTALHATALRWEHPRSMRDLPMPPADLPLVTQLEVFLGARLPVRSPSGG
jgi:8-oxo-dGTP diphosphatase